MGILESLLEPRSLTARATSVFKNPSPGPCDVDASQKKLFSIYTYGGCRANCANTPACAAFQFREWTQADGTQKAQCVAVRGSDVTGTGNGVVVNNGITYR